jgi:2-aminoethylphosphonate-pyruvate transaminase
MIYKDVNPYLLLTPGPLSTSYSVKSVMLKDWCTWDQDYNEIVQIIRKRLVGLATSQSGFTSVLMQGSGTFCVESAIGTLVPENGKLLVLANGAYGERIAKIAGVLRIECQVYRVSESERHDPGTVMEILATDPDITHVAMVHCETTTGMLNSFREIAVIVRAHHRVFILDAMSSFGGIPLDMDNDHIDVLISSANKCIQGVPGFGFVILKKSIIEALRGNARSLSLDLFDQWQTMEEHHGKWRFTSPTHTVRAFYQALLELESEGGVEVRHQRYRTNHQILVGGMGDLGFQSYLPSDYQSPVITSFVNPEHPDFRFDDFYQRLKSRGFVIYPGKVTDAETFRIGNIGEVYPEDISTLLQAIKQSIYWN